MNIHERIGKALEDAELTDTSNVTWIEGSGDQREHTQMIRDLLTALKSVGLTIVERDPFGDDGRKLVQCGFTIPHSPHDSPSFTKCAGIPDRADLTSAIQHVRECCGHLEHIQSAPSRQTVIDTLAERITKIEDWTDQDRQSVINTLAERVAEIWDQDLTERVKRIEKFLSIQHGEAWTLIRDGWLS